MIVTVLASESYLFTPREIHLLQYILDLACKYPKQLGRNTLTPWQTPQNTSSPGYC